MHTKRRRGWLHLVAGLLLVGYGLWALYSGRVASTWFRTEYRPGVIYWVTVGALLLLGGANVVVGVRRLVR